MLLGLLKNLNGQENRSKIIFIELQSTQTTLYKNLCIMVLIILVVMLAVLGWFVYLVAKDTSDDTPAEDERLCSPQMGSEQTNLSKSSSLSWFACLRPSSPKSKISKGLPLEFKNGKSVQQNADNLPSPKYGPKTEIEQRFAGSLSQIDEDLKESIESNQNESHLTKEAKSSWSQVSTDLTNGAVVAIKRKRLESACFDTSDPDIKMTDRTSRKSSKEKVNSSELFDGSNQLRDHTKSKDSLSRNSSQLRESGNPEPRSARRVKSFGSAAKLFDFEQLLAAF
jgi:hypothetical protein